MVDFSLTKLTFSGGQEIDLEKSSLIILIGANSSGKSRALGEITEHLWGNVITGNEHIRVVKELKTDLTGEDDAWRDWLRSNFQQVVRHDGVIFKSVNSQLHSANVNLAHNLRGPHFAGVARFLVRSLDTKSRLTLTAPTTRIDPETDSISHEFHVLQLDDRKLVLVNRELRAAFNRDLILDYGAGTNLRAYTGKEPERTLEKDRISHDYLDELRKQPSLDTDGDGIKSFIACLLATRCNPHKVFLIDEPEAFLHPPQARRLGRSLAQNAHEESRQIIIATHSSDIIKGALSYYSGKVQVIRIERIGETNNAYSLNNDEIRNLWDKPLLKSTDAIQGAFHRGVIVCEADADCRFYEGILTHLEALEFNEPADLHFVHGGGKGELATLALSYKRLHVPVAVIADFDILKNKEELKKLIEVLGGDFPGLEVLYKTIISNLNNLSPSKDKTIVSNTLRELASKIDNGEKITSEYAEYISDTIQEARDWSQPKKYGITSLRGGTYQECERLLETFAGIGLFIVPQGELESWDRSLPAKKSEWIKTAINQIDQAANSFEDARKFIMKIASHLGIQHK